MSDRYEDTTPRDGASCRGPITVHFRRRRLAQKSGISYGYSDLFSILMTRFYYEVVIIPVLLVSMLEFFFWNA